MKNSILIANGDIPSLDVIDYLMKSGCDNVVCADGGGNSARELGLIPDCIVGDLDSLTKDNYEFFRNKTEVIKLERQNDTDVEKSLKYIIDNGGEKVFLLGGTGDRLDHTFCNIGIVLKYFDKIKIQIIHRTTILAAYTGDVSLQTIPGETISINGILPETKILSSGLKYELNNVSLPFGVRESTSNVTEGTKVDLKISNGKVFVMRDFNLLRENDLIHSI